MDTPTDHKTVTLSDGSPCTFWDGAWEAVGEMLAKREALLLAEQEAADDRHDAARADAEYERRQARREYLDEF